MSESNVPEIIKYLTEDNLKLMYSRLNRRYLVVDALPSVDSLEPADKNVIYVVKETVGETVRYWPNVLDNDVWKPFGIGQADLDGKADKVEAVEGHLVVADKDGNLVDADIMPGTFVALAIDPSESIQPHATDLRKIWKAYQSGMPVTLLDNRPGGSGLYAQLNAAGYTWADGNRMAEYLADVDDDNRQCDGTIHGYCTELDGVVQFYEDDEHTVEIIPENGKLYCDDTVSGHDRVYLYNDGFVRALRFVQFSCNELIDDDPAWPSRRATRQVFYRMTEPYGSSSPDGFEVAYGESTADIHDQMVTGARIGEGKLLPVDDGVIVLPKSTAVNDGTLTITVGESEPVVFSANDSTDRAVDIPVATDEVAGLVRITSDVDSDDPDVAITATAVLNELDRYVQKVDDTTAGHIAVFTSEGSMSDSGISSTDVESAIGHDHTHDNKSILDEVTAPYTTEEQAKLAGIEIGAQANVIETVKVNGTALPVTNKAVDIDMPDKADKVPSATSGNFAGLDASGNLTDSGSKAADFATAEQGEKADTAYQKPDGGIPKADLDQSVQDSLDKADTALQAEDIEGKEDKSNKVAAWSGTPDDDHYPTEKLVKDALDQIDTDLSVKADKVSGATNGNFAGLDANGNLTDSGSKASDFATAAQGAKADSAIQGISVNGTAVNPDANKNVAISIPKSVPDPSASNQMLFSTDGSTWVPMTWETISFNTVTIGGKQYTTATVGSQIWLVGNLDLTWDGLVPSEAGTAYLNEPRANYYSDDESTYGWNGKKYGLLYNWAAVRYMDEHANTLFEGWHVPTSDEWNTLKQSLGASGAYELMTTTEWIAENGSDLYGFSAVPSGIRGASPSYAYGGNGARANFWTKTHPGDSKIVATMWTMRGDNGAFYYDDGAFKDTQGSVRLVKDV